MNSLRKRKKVKVFTTIPSELDDFLHQNRIEGARPFFLSQWIEEKLQEEILWNSNRTMKNDIDRIHNRTVNIFNRLDTIERRLLSLERK